VTAAALSAAAVLACAGLLVIPLDLRFALGSGSLPRVEVEWLFGLLRTGLRTGGGPGRRGRPPASIDRWLRAWRAGLGDGVPRLLRSLRRGVRVRRMQLRARVGLGDPAETGFLVGWAAPLLAVARAAPALDLRLEPDFAREVLEGEAHGELRAFPLLVLPPLLRFALSPATLRSLRALRSRR
jgi:hypothetical protein